MDKIPILYAFKSFFLVFFLGILSSFPYAIPFNLQMPVSFILFVVNGIDWPLRFFVWFMKFSASFLFNWNNNRFQP